MERETSTILGGIRGETDCQWSVIHVVNTLNIGEYISANIKIIVIVLQFEKRGVKPNTRATRLNLPSYVQVVVVVEQFDRSLV